MKEGGRALAKPVSEIIMEETLKRKETLSELSSTRSVDANRRKLKAWAEIQDTVLLQCRKLMSIAQIKRVWRGRKTHVRDVLLREKRYRSATGGGCDFSLERDLAKASASLTEAEIKLARCLGKEAVMCGLGHMETFVDRGLIAILWIRWRRKDAKLVGGQKEGVYSDSTESALEGNFNGWRDGGRAARRREEDGGRERRVPSDSKDSCNMQKRRLGELSDASLEECEIERVGGLPQRYAEEEGREGGVISSPPHHSRRTGTYTPKEGVTAA
ncbi:unnamed protein product [Cylicocyclus nassatus]|uniref:Regulatory protein zeste n=1 Tax=Cylicocyclus nassatus TaxID=53992 RepID=A0AA36GIV4_CYLNA|nr:unnamed protein product [Cylicocyclus nassatus]